MLKSKNFYIFGYSGHAYVVLDVAIRNGFNPVGYFDITKAENNPYGLEFLGSEDDVNVRTVIENGVVFPGIGSNKIREKLNKFCHRFNIEQIVLVDPLACVSKMAKLGDGTIVMQNAAVNSLAQIGLGCIINTGAIVEHECSIGNYSHIAPGATLAGNVTIGSNVFVGANAVIKQGITIGNDVVIGAGAVVVKNIPVGEIWIGNPAIKIVGRNE